MNAGIHRIDQLILALARYRSLTVIRKLVSVIRTIYSITTLLRISFQPSYAQKVYWSWPSIKRLYRAAKHLNAHLWLANDWTTLPLAARLAEENGGVYVYDTHELAVEEYAESLKWRVIHRPTVKAIEGHFVCGAATISAVSSGIAEKLNVIYCLSKLALVIRNTPPFQQAEFRETGSQIRVLYHGIISPHRGLEAAIDSVPCWRSEFTLTIRGMGDPAYLGTLRRRINDLQLDSRVIIAPPVPMTDLVREAMKFDVGFFSLPGHSLHNVYALPNKFFEYIMAGLALCVSDLPEMARLVTEYDLGVTIPGVQPESIASAINSLDSTLINRYKCNSLAAAKNLCWEQESVKMLRSYESLLSTSKT